MQIHAVHAKAKLQDNEKCEEVQKKTPGVNTHSQTSLGRELSQPSCSDEIMNASGGQNYEILGVFYIGLRPG